MVENNIIYEADTQEVNNGISNCKILSDHVSDININYCDFVDAYSNGEYTTVQYKDNDNSVCLGGGLLVM